MPSPSTPKVPDEAVGALRNAEWAYSCSPSGPDRDSEEWARMRLEAVMPHIFAALLSPDDVKRLGEIAGELEHLPPEIRRHLDQDGRDARFLRILQLRFADAISGGGE